MLIQPDQYTVTVNLRFIDSSTVYEARIDELPDAVEYGSTEQEAYELALDTISTAQEAYLEQGRSFPPPKGLALQA